MQHAEVVAEEADQWRPGQEGGVSDGCHRADAAGGIAGIVSGRTHADRKAQGGAQPPCHRTDDRGYQGAREHDEDQPDEGKQHRSPQHGHSSVTVE